VNYKYTEINIQYLGSLFIHKTGQSCQRHQLWST